MYSSVHLYLTTKSEFPEQNLTFFSFGDSWDKLEEKNRDSGILILWTH